jgi:hypothetical protein
MHGTLPSGVIVVHRSDPRLFVQAFEGRENGIEYFPVIVQARHFGPPWIGWKLALAAIGMSTTFDRVLMLRFDHLP